MSLAERAALAVFRRLDPEFVHGLALKALNSPFASLSDPSTSPRLETEIAGLSLPNPIGLAAGFDKNAVAVAPLMRSGFGFLEVGAATPRPQVGNPKPRLYRLSADRAVINRFGFNNEGVGPIRDRLAQRPNGIPVGLNLGANKDSADRADDFANVLATAGPVIDFATVNVSSPNTEKLRDLQGRAALTALLDRVMAARSELDRQIPVFLKIAPDLSHDELAEIADVAAAAGIDAIVATNTTLSRDGLTDGKMQQTGGLSGAPLFEKSTRVLAQLSELTNGQMPLIGVGGISGAEDAYAKIRAGASAVQLYSAMVFEGISLVRRITSQLDLLLKRDGFDTLAKAVGTGRGEWL